MMKNRNFVGQSSPVTGSETEFFECNFVQPAPVDIGGGVMRGVRLWPGDDTPRKFTGCNLINAEPPPGSTVIGGNSTMKDFALVTGNERFTINGVVVVVDTHSDRIYGRRLPDGTYADEPAPVDVEID